MNQLCGELQNVFTNGDINSIGTAESYYLKKETRGHRDFVMSRSELVEFNRCPHRWLAGYESEDNKATEWGSLMDCLVLTPEQFGIRFAVCPEKYTDEKGNKKPWRLNANACKAWEKEHEGKQFVKYQKYKEAEAAARTVGRNRHASLIIPHSKRQVFLSGDYVDSETGLTVPCKALLDLVPDGEDLQFGKVLLDLKTTTNASEGAWTKKVWEMSYHVQAAFYLDLYTAATMEDRTDFWHIVQESSAPWETVIWPLSSDFIELGRIAYRDMLARYCQCLKNDTWPSYTNGKRWIQPQPYMLTTSTNPQT